jgi:predicted RNase H-like nuclease (RuvC/YqgF family)
MTELQITWEQYCEIVKEIKAMREEFQRQRASNEKQLRLNDENIEKFYFMNMQVNDVFEKRIKEQKDTIRYLKRRLNKYEELQEMEDEL